MYFQRQQRFGQRHMDGNQEIIQEVLDYLLWLQEPHESFGGMPVCPFVKGDFLTDNIKFSVYSKRHDKSLIEHIKEYEESGKRTGLIVQLDPIKKPMTRKVYQKYINNQMKENDLGHLKSLVFDPTEDFKVAGVDTRKMAPCVLLNITSRKELGKAAKTLNETKWYDGFLLEDFKRLKPKTYKKKIKELNG